jgi:pyruvate dehydrogenase E1 component beta subunit
VVRCPVGGGRGYGPTHSQSPQKHFVGVPNLALYELTPFHDNAGVLDHMLSRGEPCILFEDKVLYTRPYLANGHAADIFRYDFVGGDPPVARIFAQTPDEFDCVIIVPGGMAYRALSAMRSAFVEDELDCLLFVPVQLYPFDIDPLLPALARAGQILVVEESVAGGTWGSEVAQAIHSRLWNDLRNPVRLVHSADSVIPTATHLEDRVLVQDATIRAALKQVDRG